MYQVCGTCEHEDDRFCERFGILVDEDDTACKQWVKRRIDAEREKEDKKK